MSAADASKGSKEPKRFAFSPRGMVSHRALEGDRGGRAHPRGGRPTPWTPPWRRPSRSGSASPRPPASAGRRWRWCTPASPQRTIALDGSSRAPNRATPESLGKPETLRGWKATTVPSTPATLAYALRQYGTLPLDRVLAPAIAIAEEGFEVSALLHTR